MRQLTAPMPLVSPFSKHTAATALVFEEDIRCASRYRYDTGIDYLPHYLTYLKDNRARRRPQH